MLDSVFTYSDATALDEAEEVRLIAQAQSGDKIATERLLVTYGPALRSAVSRFAPGSRGNRVQAPGSAGASSELDLDDVRSAAVVAFLEMVAEHDPLRHPRLAGRIAHRLTNRLAEELAATTAFTVPERTLSRFHGILRAAGGDIDVARRSAGHFGMSASTFLAVLDAVRHTGSLDALISASTHGPSEAGAEIAAESVFASQAFLDVEDRILVQIAFHAVDDDEARICQLAYGFTDHDPVPDAEIAHRMGLTRPTVQRKRCKALGKMRKALGVLHA